MAYSPIFNQDGVIGRSISAVSVTATSYVGDGSLLTGITGQANTASNIGSGTNIFVHRIGENLVFRSISGAGGITIAQSGSGIEISSTTSSGEANTISNTGTGTGVYRQKVGINFELKSLSAGANIGITDDGTQISISSAASQGTGGGLPYPLGATAGVNLQTFGLTANSISSGAGISGTTVSATTLLAGNFMTATASLQSSINTLNTIQSNYAVLTANNVFSSSFTAVSISSITISGNTISASLLLNGQFASATANISTLQNIQTNYAVLTANNVFSASMSALSISSLNISGNAVSAGIILNGQLQTVTADVSILKNIQTNYAVLSANNVFTGSITASSISSLNISGNTISAGVLLAGNFQTITASQDSRLTGLESATSNLNSHLTGTDSGTGSLQTQVGSLWNSKIPYSGASANVNLTTYGLTAGSISSGGGITGTTISAVTLLAGNFQSITSSQDSRLTGLETATSNLNSHLTGTDSGTGSLQTQIGSLWNSKVPYTGASANVNLTTFALTAGSISSGGGITGTTVSATTLLAGNFQTITASLNAAATGERNTVANLIVSGSQTANIFAQKVGDTFQNKALVAGTNLGLTEFADRIVLSSSVGVGESNTLVSVGGSVSLTSAKIGTELRILTLSAGRDTLITRNDSLSTITIAANLAGVESGTAANAVQITTLNNLQANYAVLSATNNFTNSNSISALGITGSTVSANLFLAGNFMVSTASLQSSIDTLNTVQSNYAALTSRNVFTNSLTAVSLSAQGLTGSTVSAGVLLAGNFQSATATLTTAATGERNTGTNLVTTGSATGGIFAQKSGDQLQFKSIVAGTNLGLTEFSDRIVLSGTAGGGETNTLTSYGVDLVALTAAKAGVALGLFGLSAGSNIGLTRSESLSSITISAAGSAPAGSFTGGQVSSAYWVSMVDGGTAALSAITINFNRSNVWKFVVTGGTTTATLQGASAGGRYLALIGQGSTTGGVLFSPTSILWSNGIAPGLSTTAGIFDAVSFVYDGSNYYGTYASQQTATNVYYSTPAISISSASGLSCSKGAGATACMAIVVPTNSFVVITAAGDVGGGTTQYPIWLKAPNSSNLHSIRVKQASAADVVPFTLQATTTCDVGWNGNICVQVNPTTSASDISIVATIYQGARTN